MPFVGAPQVLGFMTDRGVIAETDLTQLMWGPTRSIHGGGHAAVSVSLDNVVVMLLNNASQLANSVAAYQRQVKREFRAKLPVGWRGRLELAQYITTVERDGEPHPSGTRLTFEYVSPQTLLYGRVNYTLCLPALALLLPITDQNLSEAMRASGLPHLWPLY